MRSHCALVISHASLVLALTCPACVTNGTDSSGAADATPPPSSVATAGQACSGASCVSAGACRPGQASAQFRKQQPPPEELRPGARAWASVTFDNCSGRAWSAATFVLRPSAPSDEATWGLGSARLPTDVPDGASVTIPFEVVAPSAAGTYPFTWAIAGEGVGTFEERSPLVEVAVRYSADCTQPGPAARFRGWSVPEFVALSDKVHASVTFANCSTVTWTRDVFALGSQADQDNTTWGSSRVKLPSDVPAQTEVTIPVEVTAPKSAGSYRFAWKIVEEGKSWSDEGTPVAQITALEPFDCTARGALSSFVREEGVPGALNPGDGFHANVTFANCGKEQWGGSFHLGAASPSDDGVWGAGRIALPLTVAPGYALTVPIDGRAPGTGSYPYRWTVVHDGVGPVDEPSPEHTVSVRCLPSCGDHDCGGDGCGGACGACAGGFSCDGAHCREIAHVLSCGNVQWWNRSINYGPYMSYGWWDTDLNVSSGTPIQLRHDSRLYKWGVYGWGYMPEFVDLVTGEKFRFLHMRPADLWATSVGTVYPAGFVVGLSGGDTADTGLGAYSTGAHLCVQTLAAFRACFPAGTDACK